MKTFKILSAAILTALIVSFTSCGPSREYSYNRYPSRTSVSLIISSRPGWGESYRSPEGYIYWRGYDNRYYLDRSYLNRGRYNNREYDEWKHNGKKYKRRGRH